MPKTLTQDPLNYYFKNFSSKLRKFVSCEGFSKNIWKVNVTSNILQFKYLIIIKVFKKIILYVYKLRSCDFYRKRGKLIAATLSHYNKH